MLNIIIVDDEEFSCEQVKFELERGGILSDNSFRIFTCKNATEVLQLVKSTRPDLLITDIKMPKMLGTELAKKISSKFPSCRILFMSGYSDSEYLKIAIKLNAVDYIEKPINGKELCTAVNKAIKALSDLSRINETSDGAVLDKLFKSNTSVNCPKLNGTYICAVIFQLFTEPQLDVFIDLLHGIAKKNGIKLMMRLKKSNITEGLFYTTKNDIKDKISSFCKDFFENISSDDKIKIAVGSIECSYKNSYRSYENAVCTLDSLFFYDYNMAAFYNENNFLTDTIPPEKYSSDICNAIAENDIKKAFSLLDDLYNSLTESQTVISSVVKKEYYNIIEAVHSFSKDNYLSFHNMYSISNDAYAVFEASSLSETHQIVSRVLQSLDIFLNENPTNPFVKKALSFISENYTNMNLSIVDIAEHCIVNTNYLCSVFKNSTGDTINHYINNLRISLAKKLMLETDKTINEIATSAGYNDAKYFCKVFNKYTGMSPSSFRKKYNFQGKE